jgi:hypothetical protein
MWSMILVVVGDNDGACVPLSPKMSRPETEYGRDSHHTQ